MKASSQKSRVSGFHVTVPLFITFFLDSFGLVLVLPIFAPLLLFPEHEMLPAAASLHEKILWISILIAAFPLAQFIGAPLIGEMADRWGRKKAFMFSLTIVVFGYLFSALSIYYQSLVALVLSRLLTGFAAANRTICLAAFSDIFTNLKRRKRYFGGLAAIEGISFVVAILIGGTLSNHELNEFFSPSLPFFVATAFAVVNWIIIATCFQETRELETAAPFDLIKGFHEIKLAFTRKSAVGISWVFFFIVLSWMTTLQFNSVYAIEEFHVQKPMIVWIYVVMGACWGIGAWVLTTFFSNYVKSSLILGIALLGMVGSFAMDYFILHPFSYLFTIGLTSLFSSLAWPTALALSSFISSSKTHGKIQGINQSVGALAMILGPFLINYVLDMDIRFLHLFSSLSALLAFLTFLFVRNSPTNLPNPTKK